MPTNGKYSFTQHDYDSEVTTASFNTTVLTAANFDAQAALRSSLYSAIDGITNGLKTKTEFGNVVEVATGEGPAGSHRELRWLVQYHDPTTLRSYTSTIGCADDTELDPDDRKHAHIGDAGNVDAFVSAFEAYVLTPDGGVPVIDEITLVGANV